LGIGTRRDQAAAQDNGGFFVENPQEFARAVPFRVVSPKEFPQARFFGHFQGFGVAANRMLAEPLQDKGVVGGYTVQVFPGGIPVEGSFPGPVLKVLLVPPAAMNHRSRLRGNAFQAGPPFFHQLVYRQNPPDIDLVYPGTEMPKVKV
jgi:hypothetical protein